MHCLPTAYTYRRTESPSAPSAQNLLQPRSTAAGSGRTVNQDAPSCHSPTCSAVTPHAARLYRLPTRSRHMCSIRSQSSPSAAGISRAHCAAPSHRCLVGLPAGIPGCCLPCIRNRNPAWMSTALEQSCSRCGSARGMLRFRVTEAAACPVQPTGPGLPDSMC